MFWVIIFVLKWGQIIKKLLCCPALELFCCLPPLVLTPTFLLSAPTFQFSTPMDNSKANRKKSYKMQQIKFPPYLDNNLVFAIGIATLKS